LSFIKHFELAELNGDADDDVNESSWQPGTLPLTLLRLLGIGQSLDGDHTRRRPPLPDPRLSPGFNRGKTNSSSSFFGGFSRPGVPGRAKFGARREKTGALFRAQDDAQPVVYLKGKEERRSRLPHMQITPSDRGEGQQRWLSRDRHYVTAAESDVTGNTTGNSSESASLAQMSTSFRNVTVAPEVSLTSREGSDDNETEGALPDSFHHNPPPVWPGPQHPMTLFPPDDQQQRFGPPLPRFGGFPDQRGAPRRIFVPTVRDIHTVDLPPGQSSSNWNGMDHRLISEVTELPALNPYHQDTIRVRTSPDQDWEPQENVDDPPERYMTGRQNVEEELPTKMFTRQTGFFAFYAASNA